MAPSVVVLHLLLLLVSVQSFTVRRHNSFSTRLGLVDSSTDQTERLLSLSLPKPLGLILEEVQEGTANGVFIQQVNEGGSAFEYADSLQGCQLAAVQGVDVTRLAFDDVMQLIMDAPETVSLQVMIDNAEAAESSNDSPTASYEQGTVVTIRFQQPGAADLEISAKVGDNLRTTLLENGVEVYQGLKQKLGNCGGGGTCTFCAMDLVESLGWLDRSDYEDKKLAKFPQARLACLNSIQGPATIRKTQR